MISIKDALHLIAKQGIVRHKKSIPVSSALGSYLAEDIFSPLDLPLFDNSAMDGYAVSGFSNQFKIVGEIPAGDTANHLIQEGQAFRIFTGARVPPGTTAVIMQEKVKTDHDKLIIEDQVTPGKNIRIRGEELAKGQLVFRSGQKINPAAIGLLLSLGLTKVTVFSKPKVAILTTGTELIQPGKSLKDGQIYESNGPVLESALGHYGFSCKARMHLHDDVELLRQTIQDQIESVDVILLSGGISVGDYDFVSRALAENDVEQVFYKVKQKPGKPLYFGRKDQTYAFALPGNPASALTCFYIYVLPFLQRLSGGEKTGLTKIKVPLAHNYNMKSDRPTFLKAFVNKEVTILEHQGSSMLYSLAIGNALILLKGPMGFKAGELVDCFLLG